MTREEAIDVLQEKHDECKAFYDLAAHPEEAYPGVKEYMEALQMALAALCGPTREQVEKMWRGEWKTLGAAKYGKPGVHYCTKCEECHPYKHNFCPDCGSPMTDEAVDIVMRRLEALKDEID